MNRLNKDGKPSAEGEEGRPLVKENTHQPSTHSTLSEVRVSQGLAGVRKAAKERKGMQFTAPLHHLTVGLLREGFYALKRKAAPGVDGVTWEEYESGLEGRLDDLHSRVHRGAYRAQPSRRVYIPKADGRQRPLGVAALEDKIVQHAVVAILNQIYEEDFRGFSYGFRPGRSQHQALDAFYVAITANQFVHNPPPFHFGPAEIDQQGEGESEGLQVVDALRQMLIGEMLQALDLHQQAIFDQQLRRVRADVLALYATVKGVWAFTR